MSNLKGTIESVKMKETVVVAVAYSMRHPKYGKIIKKTTRLSVHNEIEGLAIGDVVELVGCRPYSRTVFFKVVGKVGTTTKFKKEPEPAKAVVEEKVKLTTKKSKTKIKK